MAANESDNFELEQAPANTDSPKSDSRASISSQESLIEVEIGNLGFTKDEHGRPAVEDVPSIQTMDRKEIYDPDRIPKSVFTDGENLSQGEWSTASDESLFSINPKSCNYGGDQGFVLTEEMPGGKEDIVEDDGKIGKESLSEVEEEEEEEEKEEQMKEDDAVTRCSDGSGSSNYSFTFPILVSNLLPNGTRMRPSRLHHGSNTRQRPSSSYKRVVSWLSFPCHSCLSCCSCESCCTRQSFFARFTLPSCCKSCSSCCTLSSCKSCLPCWNCPSRYLCCTRLFGRCSCRLLPCPCCEKCSWFSCWPCR